MDSLKSKGCAPNRTFGAIAAAFGTRTMVGVAADTSSTMGGSSVFTPSNSGFFSPRDASMGSATTVHNPTTTTMFSPTMDAPWSAKTARKELRQAVATLSHVGLKLAAKWACEQLVGMPSSIEEEETAPSTTPPMVSQSNDDLAFYAKSLLDLGEYAHAAAILSRPSKDVGTISTPLPHLSSFGIYIRAYAMYLAGERRKEEEFVELKEPLERTTLRNPHLSQLCDELLEAYTAQSLDAFGLYVFGMVLKEREQSRLVVSGMDDTTSYASHDVLMDSILAFCWNWSAWLDLADLCLDDPALLASVETKLQSLTGHYMYHFFCAHVFAEDQAQENAITIMERLMYSPDPQQQDQSDNTDEEGGGGGGLFQHSPYLVSRLAVANYHLRDFDVAEDCFLAIRDRDPYRLEDMDVYSNILYVRENRVALSQLAHGSVRVDKYRPETCCVVGNYYSIKSQRSKAVQYFQRALKLNRNYLSAWTLMGHEYVELKNTPAAMEAYRRAVDVNERDYRAWYGLGQTYEILDMHLYALFYYRKAAALRPYDARMWCAMGGCYLGLNKRADAIRTYERAVSHNDTEGIATQKLAALYREDGHEEKAARCYMRHLELRYHATAQFNRSTMVMSPPSIESILNSVVVQTTEAEALLFLASYHKRHGEYETAALCCSRLLEYAGPEKEEGKALLREIRSRREQSGMRSQSSDLQDSSMDDASSNKDESSFEFSP